MAKKTKSEVPEYVPPAPHSDEWKAQNVKISDDIGIVAQTERQIQTIKLLTEIRDLLRAKG